MNRIKDVLDPHSSLPTSTGKSVHELQRHDLAHPLSATLSAEIILEIGLGRLNNGWRKT
jgi:hypothetical protein